MTEEELEKEAKVFATYYESLFPNEFETFYKAFFKVAEPREKRIEELDKENAELRRVAEFQQSNNMNRHFENKKLKECLTVGTTWNKALNSMNKTLEEERDKYRNMVFDKDAQLTKARGIIQDMLMDIPNRMWYTDAIIKEAEQFLKEDK